MTETTTEQDTETPEGTAGEQEHTGSKLHKEAARYRTQLRETEAERDTLAERLAQAQTRELHRLAGEHLANPEDISLAGKELSEFLTPEGWLAPEAVKAAAEEILETRPGLSVNPVVDAIDHSQGHGNHRSIPEKPSWGALFR